MFHLPVACWSRGGVLSFSGSLFCLANSRAALPSTFPLSTDLIAMYALIFVFAKSWNLIQENSNTFSLDSYKNLTFFILLCNNAANPLSPISKLRPKAERWNLGTWEAEAGSRNRNLSSAVPRLLACGIGLLNLRLWSRGHRDTPQSRRRKGSLWILWWKSLFYSSSPNLKSDGIPAAGH